MSNNVVFVFILGWISFLILYYPLQLNKIPDKRGITNEREALETCLKTFETDGLLIHNPNTTFSSGLDVPDLGDIVMYGVLRSVEKSLSTSNQGELFREGSALKVWYDTMQKETSY